MRSAVMRLLGFLGRTERRVVLAILTTALIPLLGSLLIGRTIIDRITATAFVPEFGQQLEKSLDVYADLAKAIKQAMRAEGATIAASPTLRHAVAITDEGARRSAVDAELTRELAAHPTLVSLSVESEQGAVVARKQRAAPVDPAQERTLEVRKSLVEPGPDDDTPALQLVAVFATESARFTEMENAHEVLESYRQMEQRNRGAYLTDTYRAVFGVLVLITVVVGMGAGVLVVRPVVTRIERLAEATRPVAQGDLSIRVDESGSDEVSDLGKAFNRMLGELESSRARIEFLRRMGEWQKMARRLAHEIKNPLTPIQLAVEEVHRRYTGGDPAFSRIVQTTMEVVEEEVGTLRRLVTEFASFARLPRAELAPADLAEYLREQSGHLIAPEPPSSARGADAEAQLLRNVEVSFEGPPGPLPVAIDGEMLHRVLVNLVRNAAQALRDAGRRGRVELRLTDQGPRYLLTVDDDGPGIPPELRDSVFDPYVTTKKDGTGLGLTIVKKVVVDHGGTIDVERSPLGGARFAIRLPRAGTPAATAAMERSLAAAD
jgi:nitrogen fixation/metabolism regulation signal transduction histidine kinase